MFVSRALPGDRVRARVTKLKRRHAEARTIELLEPGPGRVRAALRALRRLRRLRLAGPRLRRAGAAQGDARSIDALRRLGRLEVALEPIVPAAEQYGYRNKLEYSWSTGPAGAVARLPPGRALGRAGAGRDLPHRLAGRKRRPPGVRALGARGRPSRLRRGDRRGLPAPPRRSRGRPHRAAPRHARDGAGAGARRWIGWQAIMPEGVVGVAHAVNPGVAEATAGLESVPLFGADRYEELVGGLRLAVTAGAFMQTNTVMSERLYELAIEYAELCARRTSRGISTAARARSAFSRPRAPAACSGSRSPRSRSPGRARTPSETASRTSSSSPATSPRASRRCSSGRPRPDVVFVDPPRAGLTPKAVKRLLELGARADRLRVVQPDDARPERPRARGRRLHAGARPPGRHVPAHAAHRVRRPPPPRNNGVRPQCCRRSRAPLARDGLEHLSAALDRREVDPLLDGMRPGAGRGRTRRSGSRPPRAPPRPSRRRCRRWRARVPAPSRRGRRTASHDRRVGRDFEGRPLERRAHPRRRRRSRRSGPRRRPASRPAPCAARSEEGSARGSSRAPGRPRSARRAPSPCRAADVGATRASRGAELRRGRRAPAHRGDRVDAQVGARAVRGDTVGLDVEPDEPLVGDAHLELGRLGDDRRVGRASRPATRSAPIDSCSSSQTSATMTSPRRPALRPRPPRP